MQTSDFPIQFSGAPALAGANLLLAIEDLSPLRDMNPADGATFLDANAPANRLDAFAESVGASRGNPENWEALEDFVEWSSYPLLSVR